MSMDIASSGMRVADLRLAVSANNIANMYTPGFKSSRVSSMEQPNHRGISAHIVKTDSGPDLSTEMVEHLLSLRYMQANGAVFSTSAEMSGEIINLYA